jgi:hypothetical protein
MLWFNPINPFLTISRRGWIVEEGKEVTFALAGELFV